MNIKKNKNEKISCGSKANDFAVFGELDKASTLYLAEGEADASAINACTDEDHVAIPVFGVQGAEEAIKTLKSRFPKKRLILAFGNDEKGIATAKKCANTFNICYTLPDVTGIKDFNELYCKKGKEAVLEQLKVLIPPSKTKNLSETGEYPNPRTFPPTSAVTTMKTNTSPPQAEAAEQSILGGLMQDNNCWDEISHIVKPNDFYRQEHRIIFTAIKKLADKGKPLDMVTVPLALKDSLSEVGGESYLYELMEKTPDVGNIKVYAELVREESVKRGLISCGNRMIAQAFSHDEKTADQIINTAQETIFKLSDSQDYLSSATKSYQEVMERTLAYMKANAERGDGLLGSSTGFKALDKITKGFYPAEYIILGARPSMGKTAFALNLAVNVAKQTTTDKPVLFFSLEMPIQQLGIRLLSSELNIYQSLLETNKYSEEERKKLENYASKDNNFLPMIIDESSSLNVIQLKMIARRQARQHNGLSLIVIDYLQLINVDDTKKSYNKNDEVQNISRQLRAMAKELDVPVLCLSQLNRGLEQRSDKRPVMSDLRDSGAIEQDADLILFLYRDEVYDKDTSDKGIAEIIISKNRNGGLGMVKLYFEGAYCRFSDSIKEKPYTTKPDTTIQDLTT